MKRLLLILLIFHILSGQVFADECKGNASCPRTLASFKAARIVQFDIAFMGCKELAEKMKKEIADIRQSAVTASFETPEWGKAVISMEKIQKVCEESKQ